MKAVIHQPLGHVFDSTPALLQRAQIEDALVRDEAVPAFEEHREISVQPLGDVIGVEDGELRRLGQAVRAHHADVHPRDGEDAGAAPRRGGDGAGWS